MSILFDNLEHLKLFNFLKANNFILIYLENLRKKIEINSTITINEKIASILKKGNLTIGFFCSITILLSGNSGTSVTSVTSVV